MIKLTRLNGTELVVNAAMIEFLEATPDTVVSLVSGRKIIVSEPVDTVIAHIRAFYRQTGLFGQAMRRDLSKEE